MYSSEKALEASRKEGAAGPMCYTHRDHGLEREVRRVTESRLMQEEARHRHEEHRRRRERGEAAVREDQGDGRYRQIRQ
jgi:hypothetical protein